MASDRISKKIGLAPGSLVYVGDRPTDTITVSLIDYSETHLEERDGIRIEDCEPFVQSDSVTWINISGLHNTEVIDRIGKLTGLHSLLMEDVLNTEQRPKMDDYDDHIFVVLRMIDVKEAGRLLDPEQVSIVFGKRFVISFQERPGDVFGPIRDRIRKAKGRIRRSGADYLAYSLMDMIVDHYFKILESFGDRIETLQEEVLNHPEPEILQTIHQMKHQMIYMRKAVWPVREVVNNLMRLESDLVGKDVQFYLKDIHDHALQVVDTVETYRDVLSGVLDIFLTNVSNRMNEIMKVLTVIATIFIPLTFLAGIYGMNFHYMPELEWRFAYPLFWAFNITIAGVMLLWFRKKKWL